MATEANESCVITVRVHPKSSRNQVDGYEPGGAGDAVLRLRVTAPPTGGQANAGVIALLAKTLGGSKSKVRIIRGHSSRDKVVSVDTLTGQEARRRIEAAVKG
ncbi:MAG: DUF167 domain-containing protein [Chloroflexi bacterium]|nr:DUF167 domain-containing protein [Chloroflexota bacterium]MDA1271778.1 DUF167 domain-containing protein [Chloroflexota bacterium]PKB59398.1 MAG: hypothetical protein BZY83_02025 [SAR202 cluster bacterium Casp-Chloro-G2]